MAKSPYHDGTPALVRRQEHIFPTEERVAVGQWLFLRDIECGTRYLPLIEGFEQRVPTHRAGSLGTLMLSSQFDVRINGITPPNVDHDGVRRQVR